MHSNHRIQTLANADRTPAGALLWAVANLVQFAFMTIWSAWWITFALVMLCLTFDRERAISYARRFWAPGLLRAAGARMVVEGFEKLAPDQPRIYVFNHESLVDTPVTFFSVPFNTRIIAKREVAYLPFFGWYCWAMGFPLVDRRNHERAIASMTTMAKTVREGANVVVFSEGTRNTDGVIQTFKKGAFVLAINAGVPVVPCAISGSRDVLGCGRFKVRPGTIRVRAGEPIETRNLSLEDRDALISETRDRLIDLNLALGGVGGDKAAQPAPKASHLG